MRVVSICAAVVAGVVLAAFPMVAGAKTQIFMETNEAQFAQGHAEGIVWTSLGTLRLGRAVENLLEATDGVDYVARLAEAPDGTIYAVTGGAGHIYRLKDGKVTRFATLPEKFLFSIAVGKNGELYVGSGGTKAMIWRVTPQAKGDPKVEVFFETTDVKYVWDLAVMKDGALAAATGGEKGKLLRITPDKKSEVLIASEANHILCLTMAPDGTLYAGTNGPAIVYRYADKKTFVLYDADEAEVTALTLDPAGNLYVATSSGTGGRGGGAEMPADTTLRVMPAPPPSSPGMPKNEANGNAAPSQEKSESKPNEGAKSGPASAAAMASADKPLPLAAATMADKLQVAVQQSSQGSAPKRPSGGGGAAGVYKVAPDGIVSRIFDGHDTMILSLAVTDGRLLVGTGKSAHVYELGCRGDDEEACIAGVDPKQVMSLLVTREGRVLAGCAGPGRIYALSKGYAKEGTYTSQVFDAVGSARWGSVEWRSQTPDGTEIVLSTRSGNVRDADKGMWSEWSKPSSRSPMKIESPSARYVQFRVTMRGRGDAVTPVLEEYKAAYARVNEPPKVVSISEMPTQDQQARSQAMERFRQSLKPRPRTPGMAPAPPMPAQLPPPEGPQPIRIIQWQAVDPDGDALRYDVYFHGRGEPNWIPLDKDLSQNQYAWDTSTVADGWYEIRVVASDRAENPAETALEASKISDPILVDNTAPVVDKIEVQGRAGGEVEVKFAAHDATSRLADAAYTIDSATDWHPIVPTDGIFDGRAKEFRFTLHKLSPGPHRVAVRVSDEAQNIGHAAQALIVDK